MKDNNFSFIKLRDEIINKTGSSHPHAKEANKKLKFEPNLNIIREHIPITVDKTVENKEQIENPDLMNVIESKIWYFK